MKSHIFHLSRKKYAHLPRITVIFPLGVEIVVDDFVLLCRPDGSRSIYDWDCCHLITEEVFRRHLREKALAKEVYKLISIE